VEVDVNTAAVTFQYCLPFAVEFTDLSLWEGAAVYAASAAAVLEAAVLLACTSECLLLLAATHFGVYDSLTEGEALGLVLVILPETACCSQ